MSINQYGVYETNPLEGVIADIHERFSKDGRIRMDWNDPRLKQVVRLRLLSDPGCPFWDVSYCYGETKDGKIAKVDLPFHELPKRGLARTIVEYAKKDGVYARGLGILDNISKLC